MNEIFRARLALVAPLIVSGLLVSGCMSSPTYGTGKTANEQLFDDVNGILSLAPKNRNQVDYKPRPDLVKPASTVVLPAPQENIASASGAAWPESPEQKRARVRADATANRDNPGFEPLVVDDIPVEKEKRPLGVSQRMIDNGGSMAENIRARKQQREEFNRRLAENNQGSPTTRKYLSEPPLDYRTPAQTAAANDVGEDELKKERRIKKAAQQQGTGGWRDLVPWL